MTLISFVYNFFLSSVIFHPCYRNTVASFFQSFGTFPFLTYFLCCFYLRFCTHIFIFGSFVHNFPVLCLFSSILIILLIFFNLSFFISNFPLFFSISINLFLFFISFSSLWKCSFYSPVLIASISFLFHHSSYIFRTSVYIFVFLASSFPSFFFHDFSCFFFFFIYTFYNIFLFSSYFPELFCSLLYTHSFFFLSLSFDPLLDSFFLINRFFNSFLSAL